METNFIYATQIKFINSFGELEGEGLYQLWNGYGEAFRIKVALCLTIRTRLEDPPIMYELE